MKRPIKTSIASTKSMPCLRILVCRFASSYSLSIVWVLTDVRIDRETFQMPSMILVGDVNLMNVADPAVPFARLAEEMRSADLVFANLECCLHRPSGTHAVE